MTATYSPGGFCPACGYRMDAGRCPECGRDVPKPAKRPPLERRRRRLILAAIVLPLLGGAAYGVWYHGTELAVRFWPAWHLKRLGRGDGAIARWANRVNVIQLSRRSAEESTHWAGRDRLIREELAANNVPEWAGRYASGGELLTIAPRAGFTYKSSSCWNELWNHGDVIDVTKESIQLRPTIDVDDYWTGPDRALIRGEWDGVPFLVESRSVVSFVNRVNAQSLDVSDYMMRLIVPPENESPESWKPLVWKPQLPAEYAQWVRDSPLNSNVTVVGEDRIDTEGDGGGTYHQIALTLDVGTADRVFVGMILFSTERLARGGATVKSVRERDCDVAYVDYFAPDEPVVLPKIGSCFTSLGYSRRDESADVEP